MFKYIDYLMKALFCLYNCLLLNKVVEHKSATQPGFIVVMQPGS